MPRDAGNEKLKADHMSIAIKRVLKIIIIDKGLVKITVHTECGWEVLQ